MPGARNSDRQMEPFVLGQKEVVFTYLERVYFPAVGYTKEVESLEDGRAFIIRTAPARLGKTGDLWAGLTESERRAR